MGTSASAVPNEKGKGSPAPTKPSKEEPDEDVVVVVGGVEYHERSKDLRAWSDYFVGAVRSGMKEAQSKRFQFPHMRSQEWELISSILNPNKPGKVTISNYQAVLPWCSELSSKKGLDDCDGIIADILFVRLRLSTAEEIDMVLEFLPLAVQHNLRRSKEQCFKHFQRIMMRTPLEFTLEQVKRLLPLVMEDKECDEKMWPSIRQFLPSSLPTSDEKRKAMVETESFPLFLLAGIETKTKIARTVEILARARGRCSENDGRFIRTLANDEICGDLFPTGWI